MLNVVTVVGARPQFVKAAVLSRLIRSEPWRGRVSEFLIHTGQHYDDSMSEVFFREMEIPAPDVNLAIGGTSHAKMTGDMLQAIEPILSERRPDVVLVYGDTNTTLAGALAAAKLHVPVAHVEAGLRSFNRDMPEEINRLLTDHLSSWLFCPTRIAVGNLRREGIRPRGNDRPPRVCEVGDVMLDASRFYRKRLALRPASGRLTARLNLPGDFLLVTVHRQENTDTPDRLRSIMRALNASEEREMVFPAHPRTRKALEAAGIPLGGHIRMIEPVGYFDMLDLEERCSMIVTDSGGVQKEAFFLGKPCVTLRDETEWTETVRSGWNVLVGASEEAISRAIRTFSPRGRRPALYGNGDAAGAVLEVLCRS